jgi:hypothetical protein
MSNGVVPPNNPRTLKREVQQTRGNRAGCGQDPGRMAGETDEANFALLLRLLQGFGCATGTK